MFPYIEKDFLYADALNLKYPETKAPAAKHHAKQSKYFFWAHVVHVFTSS